MSLRYVSCNFLRCILLLVDCSASGRQILLDEREEKLASLEGKVSQIPELNARLTKALEESNEKEAMWRKVSSHKV